MDDLKTEVEKSIEYGGEKMPTIAEKWFQDGKIEGKIEDALKMIELKMSNEEIQKITGLDMEKIEDLRNRKSNMRTGT
jgi:predicted transposase YdaD